MCGLPSAGLTIVADVAIATGPALLRAPRSFVLNFIYYNIRLFSVYEVSILLNLPQVVSEVFQLNAVCVQKFLFDSFCTVRNKRHKIEVRRSGLSIWLFSSQILRFWLFWISKKARQDLFFLVWKTWLWQNIAWAAYSLQISSDESVWPCMV